MCQQPEVFGFSMELMEKKLQFLDDNGIPKKVVATDIHILTSNITTMQNNVNFLKANQIEPIPLLIRSNNNTMQENLKMIPIEFARSWPKLLGYSNARNATFIGIMETHNRTFDDFTPGYFSRTKENFEKRCRANKRRKHN